MLRLLNKYSFCFRKQSAVEFSYWELLDNSSNLNHKIEKAYGPEGLGISIVSDIPKYSEFR
jgi:hypothetical protein